MPEKEKKPNPLDIVSSFAHDTRNALGLITVYSDLLTRPLDSNQNVLQIEKIKKSSHQINRQIQELLNYFSLEYGDFKNRKDWIPNSAFVEETFRSIDIFRQEKCIKFNKFLSVDNFVVEIDFEKLVFSISSLLAMAIERSAKGGEIIFREHFNIETNEAEYSIEFCRDPQQTSRDICFDLISKKDSKHRPRLSGYLSRQTLESHGGRVWLENEKTDQNKIQFNLPGKLI